MKDLAKAAAGAMFLVACGNEPPEYTESLTEAQLGIVENDLQRLEKQTPFVKRLLEKADPLFTLEGKSAENNQQLASDLDLLQSDLNWYLENDHFVVTTRENMSGFLAAASGSRSDRVADNYVILVEGKGEKVFRTNKTGVYMHEAAHYYDKVNVKVHNHLTKKIESGKFDDHATYVVEENDVMYLMDYLYSVDGVGGLDITSDAEFVLEYAKEARKNKDTGELYLSGFIDEDLLDNKIRRDYQKYEDKISATEDELIEEQVELYREDFKVVASNLTFLGITQAEYFDALRESPELIQFDKDRAQEILSEVESLFPEINFEVREGENTRESDSELVDSREVESKPDAEQSRWRSSRR